MSRCPACGAQLDRILPNCPQCGTEFGMDSSSTPIEGAAPGGSARRPLGTVIQLAAPFIAALLLLPLFFLPQGLSDYVMGLALVLAFGAPLVGAIPILAANNIPLLIRLPLSVLYYAVTFVVAGAMGWGGCMFGGMCTP